MLVKTSNPGSGELQDMVAGDRLVYQVMGDLNQRIAKGTEGKYGYTMAGAVTGATYPSDIRALRKRLEHTFFLVPGYGAQGTAEDVQYAFDKYGHGAIVNSSRASCVRGRRPAGTAGILPRRPGMRPSPCGTTSGASSPSCNSSRKGRGWGRRKDYGKAGLCALRRDGGKLVPVLHHPVRHQSDPVREVHAAIPGCGGEEKIALREYMARSPHLREGGGGSASPGPGPVAAGAGAGAERRQQEEQRQAQVKRPPAAAPGHDQAGVSTFSWGAHLWAVTWTICCQAA